MPVSIVMREQNLTYLSVHFVVLVVAINERHPIIILLDPALALSVPVLPSSLDIALIHLFCDAGNAFPSLRIQYFGSTALI